MIAPLWIVCVAIAIGVAILVWRGWSGDSPAKVRCRGGSIRYGPTAGADEARKLGDYLERRAFFRPGQRDVELKREAGVYQFRLPARKDSKATRRSSPDAT